MYHSTVAAAVPGAIVVVVPGAKVVVVSCSRRSGASVVVVVVGASVVVFVVGASVLVVVVGASVVVVVVGASVVATVIMSQEVETPRRRLSAKRGRCSGLMLESCEWIGSLALRVRGAGPNFLRRMRVLFLSPFEPRVCMVMC